MFLSTTLQQLLQVLSKCPGLGPRSARRIALHLLKHRRSVLPVLLGALQELEQTHQECGMCGYIDNHNPCFFCTSPHRKEETLCVVAETCDVWALERAAFFKGRYHVLGGLISTFYGKQPEDLNTRTLKERLKDPVQEIILAMDGTLEGQTTLHYLTQQLGQWAPHIRISSLARGMPVGSELEYLDQGTLANAFLGRHVASATQDEVNQWLTDDACAK